MSILSSVLFIGFFSQAQLNDINHRVGANTLEFQKKDGKKVTVSASEDPCEKLDEDGSYATLTDQNSKAPQIKIKCENKKKSQIVTKDESGEMTENWKNGKLQGTVKKVSSKGLTMYEANYIDGKKEGEEKTYFENGQISTLRRYKNDQLEGVQIDYDQFGKPSLKFTPKALRSHRPKKKTD